MNRIDTFKSLRPEADSAILDTGPYTTRWRLCRNRNSLSDAVGIQIPMCCSTEIPSALLRPKLVDPMVCCLTFTEGPDLRTCTRYPTYTINLFVYVESMHVHVCAGFWWQLHPWRCAQLPASLRRPTRAIEPANCRSLYFLQVAQKIYCKVANNIFVQSLIIPDSPFEWWWRVVLHTWLYIARTRSF